MPKPKLTKQELIIFSTLLIENRDSSKLQRLTGLSYLDSINLLNKVRVLINLSN